MSLDDETISELGLILSDRDFQIAKTFHNYGYRKAIADVKANIDKRTSELGQPKSGNTAPNLGKGGE